MSVYDQYFCQYLRHWRNKICHHRWSLSNDKGALEFWYAGDNLNYPLSGLETHYRTPPSYMADKKPSNKICQILCAPCWHDGSSMAGIDFYNTHVFARGKIDDEKIFEALASKFDIYLSDE
jgi:hypothetical protein